MDSNVKQELLSYNCHSNDQEELSAPPKRRPRHRLSCAECRRLKLKCDRVWPCGSCTKRGCARICPEGTLQAKVRSKDTSVLLSKIAELENLVREKDQHILATAAHGSNHLHLSRSSGIQTDHHQALGLQLLESSDYIPALPLSYSYGISGGQDSTLLSLIDGIGTLNVSGDGRSRYLGLSASSAYLDEDCSDSESISSTPGTSEGPDESNARLLLPASSFFTAGAGGRRFDSKHLKSYLPDKLGAERISNAYFNFVSHMYGLLNRTELATLIEEIYGKICDEVCLTRLALLYAIFALGTLFDPGVQVIHSDARKWYEACEACLMSTDFLTNPTLSAVQAIHLMGIYMLNTRIDAAETFWPILGIAVRLCQTMGLHRDGSNWGLQSSELDQRRRTFHEILSLDRLQSLVLGRPYALSDKHYDTLIPSLAKDNASDKQENRFTADYLIHKWRFSACIGRVVDDVFSVAAPSLAVINRLDQEIRVFDASLPSSLKCSIVPPLSLGPSWQDIPTSDPGYLSGGPLSVQRVMQQHCMTVLENQTLLFLHRRAFALALSESPSEPLQSSFATSVISVIIESSRNLIMIVKAAQTVYPDMANRWWYLFFHAYSGATCVATLLIKSPGCMLAKHAWATLSATMSVFETAANRALLCRDLLTRLNRLHKHAMLTFEAFSSGKPLPKPRRLSNLSSRRRALRPLSLSSQEESSTPLAHYLESCGTASQTDSPVDDFPCDLGASTRLTRKSRRQSVSNSSVASNRVPSVSSSGRSRGTSFGSASPNDPSSSVSTIGPNNNLTQLTINTLGANNASSRNNGPNATLSAPFNSRSWALVSSPDDFDDEESASLHNPPYWDNLSVEPSNEAFSPMFTSQPPHAGYFSGFSERFHPPMALPSHTNELGTPNGVVVGSGYGTLYNSGPTSASFESPTGVQALPPPAASVPGSPPMLNLSSLSRSASLNNHQSGTTLQDSSNSNNHKNNNNVSGPVNNNDGGGGITSPTSTQFDLLDTFLTWQAYDQ